MRRVLAKIASAGVSMVSEEWTVELRANQQVTNAWIAREDAAIRPAVLQLKSEAPMH